MSSVEEFIRVHREEDVRQLALQGKHYPEIDMQFALNQIAGWQTARKKIPSWAAREGIIYPPHLSMEQCSSEQTARYKARILRGCEVQGTKYVDLTGGLGVDFSFLAETFEKAVYVERDERLCMLARQNFDVLGLRGVEVVNSDGVDYLRQMNPVDMIFLDPARRDQYGGRTIAISDCSPDILGIERELLEKATWVMVKLSPMLDWHKAVDDLNGVGDVVREVHIVSVGNECKELLIVMSSKSNTPLTVWCVNDNSTFVFSKSEEYRGYYDSMDEERRTRNENQQSLLTPQNYLYEPNSSVMKAGCFNVLEKHYNVMPVAKNSHLLISADFIENFPGRKMQILAISSVSKNVAKLLPNAKGKANITVRNFPMTAEQLRKKLKLKDGGDTYIFGTTTDDHKHIVIICRKAKE